MTKTLSCLVMVNILVNSYLYEMAIQSHLYRHILTLQYFESLHCKSIFTLSNWMEYLVHSSLQVTSQTFSWI